MSVKSCKAVWLALVVLAASSGCNGNYKFNDASYRPLGDPHPTSRMK